ENRVSVARMRYNESVQMLNTYIRTFFGRFFASLAGVSSAEYYEIPKGEEAAPKVNF
ncbi:MAG TPA: LemA family protein, partial [Nitrospirae bacterium]|nr:LemA family protein [Nitrospirota bacterium]